MRSVRRFLIAFSIELYDVDFTDYPPQPHLGAEISEYTKAQFLRQFAIDGRYHRIDKNRVASFVTSHPCFRSYLSSLNELLRPHDFQFGYRTFDEIMAYVDTAATNGVFERLGGLSAAFDAAVLMKVLPKFHGTRSRLEQPLMDLLSWCKNPTNPEPLRHAPNGALPERDVVTGAESAIPYHFPVTAARVHRMLRALEHSGFASFG